VDKYFLNLMAAHHERNGQVHVSMKEDKVGQMLVFGKIFLRDFLPYIDADEKHP